MSYHTEQLRNFLGTDNLEWNQNLWAEGRSEQTAAAEQHDSADSHISSIRKLNKPLPRNEAGGVDYTSKDMYDAAHKDNTSKNLKANFWQETANILRWATTFSLAAIALAISGGTFTAAIGIGAGVTALVAGTGLFIASRKARHLSTEKVFDNQEFIIQRQSQLIGKAVEHERGAGEDKTWQIRVGKDVAESRNWQDSVLNSLEEAPEASKAI